MFLISSDHILGELARNLETKFKYAPQDIAESVELFRSQMEIVVPAALLQPASRDPDDDIVLATAITGNARCVVTGDKDLLVLKQFNTIEIRSPFQFADFEVREGGAQTP